MNTIEQLEERIAQLTELVNTGTETLESLKETLKTVEKERDRLADQRREQEPKFERKNKGDDYFFISTYTGETSISKTWESQNHSDDNRYDGCNYFHTKERAEEVADKINFLLKLERLHDTFCPDYVPDWDNRDEYKHSVYYDNEDKFYRVNTLCIAEHKSDVIFPTLEIAQKVCDILNAELEKKK